VMNVALPGVFLGGGFLQLEKACSWSKGSRGLLWLRDTNVVLAQANGDLISHNPLWSLAMKIFIGNMRNEGKSLTT
jgi:hypothetical protein